MKDYMLCPFCKTFLKKENPIKCVFIDPTLFAVCCDTCGCQGPNGLTPQQAAEKWNIRE